MTTITHSQLNGSNTVKNNTQLFVPARLVSHKHAGEELRSGDAALDSTEHCSSGSRSSKSRKRFKPDLLGTKHRPVRNPAEDCPGDPPLHTPAKQTPVSNPSSAPSPSPSSTEEGSQEGSGNGGGTAEEEGAGEDDDGANYCPHRKQGWHPKNNIDNNIERPQETQALDCSKEYAGTPTVVPIVIPTDIGAKITGNEFLLETPETEGPSACGITTSDSSSSTEGKSDQFESSAPKSKLRSKAERKRAAARLKLQAEDAEKAATALGFTLVSRKDKALVFHCPEQHKVVFKIGQTTAELACAKCAKKYKKCLEHAKAHLGRVKDERYRATVTFQCEFGHEWKLKYCKYMFTRWCPQCEKLKREDKKRALEEMERKLREETATQQEAKLEEARVKMLEEERLKYMNYQSWFYQWPSALYSPEYQQAYMTDSSINNLAREMALKYMAEAGLRGPSDFEDIFFMHKVLMTSSQMLVAKLALIPKEECASFYRKNAVKLHPDKNRHPRSNEAFQKFTECYRYCVQLKKNP